MTVFMAAKRNKEFTSAQSAINYVKKNCKGGDYVTEWDKTNSRCRLRFLICMNRDVIDLVKDNSGDFADDIQWQTV